MRTFFGVLFISLSAISCGPMWGAHSLGNNLYLFEGDRKEDQIIIYTPNASMILGARSGSYVIPASYEQHMDSMGGYAEYVQKAISNDKWVVAKSLLISSKKENYWIINKSFDIKKLNWGDKKIDSLIQSYVIGPLSLEKFNAYKAEHDIKIDF